MTSRSIRLAALIASAVFCLVAELPAWQDANSQPGNTSEGKVYTIAPGDDVHFQIQERMITAVPGDVIQLEAGTYRLKRQLDVVADGITIRGRGSSSTILSFKGQVAGGQGLMATGDNFVIEGLAIEDTAGNAIKVLGSKNVTFQDVRVEWTGEAKASNGAYGIYPVQCENVLIEECTAIGASDAGLYVGQCKGVIVRRCVAKRNVAGIEIENTIRADVYDNLATDNAGGILVFDLPGLPVKAGGHVRVFRNQVNENNHVNFAAAGNMVAGVPSGTGVMVLATDDVEVFQNSITSNRTCNVSIVSFMLMGKRMKDETFDPIPTRIAIHNNVIRDGGRAPQGEIAKLLAPVMGKSFSDIMFDGVAPPDAENYEIRIQNNGKATFANFNLPTLTPENVAGGKHKVDRDVTHYQAKLDSIAPVVLAPHTPSLSTASRRVSVYLNAPEKLSDYDFFEGKLSDHEPATGVVPYELNTALFSDYTSKSRFIKLPAGSSIEYQQDGVLQFPVGTVIAKTFSYPHDMRDADSEYTHLETRIEELHEDGWYGFSYQWNEAQTDADLVIGGAAVTAKWIHTDGTKQQLNYPIPNANQCLTCHEQSGSFQPLGPTGRNLDRPFANGHGQGHANQLDYLAKMHQLAGLPEKGDRNALPAADEKSHTINQRARAWLDVNCAHCHNPNGTARTSGLDLRWLQVEAARIGVWKTPVAAGHGSGGHDYDIVPGKPDKSILVHRLESTDPSVQMPNLARQMVPDEAVELIRQWISEMPTE